MTWPPSETDARINTIRTLDSSQIFLLKHHVWLQSVWNWVLQAASTDVPPGSDLTTNSFTPSIAAKHHSLKNLQELVSIRLWRQKWKLHNTGGHPPYSISIREAGWAGRLRCRLKAVWFSSACLQEEDPESRRISSAGPLTKPLIQQAISAAGAKPVCKTPLLWTLPEIESAIGGDSAQHLMKCLSATVLCWEQLVKMAQNWISTVQCVKQRGRCWGSVIKALTQAFISCWMQVKDLRLHLAHAFYYWPEVLKMDLGLALHEIEKIYFFKWDWAKNRREKLNFWDI